MKISWVVAADYRLDPAVSIEHIKTVGPVWGSWQTWRGCSTDNVICHQQQKSRELLDRAFQAVCNFYLPRSLYEPLGRPVGARFYDGDFDQEVDCIEDIVAMHLAAGGSDIVLMLGFDFIMPETGPDRFERHKLINRHGLIRGAIAGKPTVQWVAVDSLNLDTNYQTLSNLTCDTMPNVLQLLL